MSSTQNQLFQRDDLAAIGGSFDNFGPVLGRDTVAPNPSSAIHDGQADIGRHFVRVAVPNGEGGLKMHAGHDTARTVEIKNICITPRFIVRPMTTPADRLRRARIDAGFETADKAATRLGVKPSGYRHHENDIRPFFDIEKAVKYARAFRVDVGWLLGIDDTAASPAYDLSAEALGQVLGALLQAYAPNKRLSPDEQTGLGAALKETLLEMMDDPQIAENPDRAGYVAQAIVRARRRAGQ